MRTESPSSTVLSPEGGMRIARLVSVCAFLVGAGVLAAWVFQDSSVVRATPGLVKMKANAALCFCLIAASLFLYSLRGAASAPLLGIISRLFAAIAAGIGVVVLAQYATGWNSGLDELLFRDPSPLGTPGRMAPISALNFTCLGAALVAMHSPRCANLAQVLAGCVGLTSLLAMVNSCYIVTAPFVSEYFRLEHFATVALYTSTTFHLLFIGVMAATSGSGLMRVVTAPGKSGKLVRRYGVVATALPLFFGWLRLFGEEHGWYAAAFGSAIFAMLNFVTLGALIWIGAVWLRKAEAQEALVQEKLLEAHAQLEERVAQRTAELARTTEELAAREVLLRQFVRHTPAAVAMLDKNLCYLQASDRWVQDYNLSEREIIGKSHYDIFPETPQHWKDVNQRVLAGAVERCEEAALPRPDGSVDWLQWEARPWLDAKGEVAGLILYTQVITERKRAEAETEALNQQFLETSRRAGMAEVATSVLHNVGNVLNSVNISSSIISEKLRKSPIDNVSRIAGLVRDNAGDLPRFFSEDPVGQKLPQFLGTLSARLEEEQQALLAEIASLRLNVEHIKEIVNVQQDYAKNIEGVREKLSIWDLVEDALRITGPGLEHHRIEVIRHFADSPRIPVEKHKVLAILVNLIKNAKHALTESEVEPKRLSFTVTHTADELTLCVNDNGIGIAPENITRIFVHGFTTRKSGHGFGLHSGALAAREMRGRLCAHSDGPGCGADFFLTLPCRSDDDAFAALNS